MTKLLIEPLSKEHIKHLNNKDVAGYIVGINNYSMTSKVAIGYKEVIQYLNNEIDYNEMVELIKKNSRHYAKRQFTWFKNQDNCQVVNINLEDFNKTIDEVYNLITVFLSK